MAKRRPFCEERVVTVVLPYALVGLAQVTLSKTRVSAPSALDGIVAYFAGLWMDRKPVEIAKQLVHVAPKFVVVRFCEQEW
jgi:hypothetical protein